MDHLLTLVTGLLGMSVMGAPPLAPPLEEDGRVGVSVDLDGDGDFECESYAGRNRQPRDGLEEFYSVGVVLRSLQGGVLVTPSPSRVPFRMGERIAAGSPVYSDLGGGNWIPIGRYYQTRFPGDDWTYLNPFLSSPHTFYSTETNLWMGCRFMTEDGVHLGWVQLTRADRDYLTQYDIVGHDWNPIPGAPIEAGLPPAIPLHSELAAEGLRVRWPAVVGLANWILEVSDSLGTEAEWRSVSEAANGEVLLDPPESTRFFRLRRP